MAFNLPVLRTFRRSIGLILEANVRFGEGDLRDPELAGMSEVAVTRAAEGGASIQNSVTHMNEVSEISLRVLNVADIINEISDRTILLSLNAAIEAAMGGLASEIAHLQETGMRHNLLIESVSQAVESIDKNAEEVSAATRDQYTAAQEVSREIQQATRRITESIDSIGQIQTAHQRLHSAMQNVSELMSRFRY